MEKKGEILNQLAIIADLLEKVNMENLFTTVTFEMEEKDFNEMFKKITKKAKVTSTDLDNIFSVKIGQIDFIFNKNSA